MGGGKETEGERMEKVLRKGNREASRAQSSGDKEVLMFYWTKV